jgi:hypothetical protein
MRIINYLRKYHSVENVSAIHELHRSGLVFYDHDTMKSNPLFFVQKASLLGSSAELALVLQPEIGFIEDFKIMN